MKLSEDLSIKTDTKGTHQACLKWHELKAHFYGEVLIEEKISRKDRWIPTMHHKAFANLAAKT